MKKEKRLLNSKMREILRVIHENGGVMTANEIANETKFSYVTVIKYLKKLEEQNLITQVGDGRKDKRTNKKMGH